MGQNQAAFRASLDRVRALRAAGLPHYAEETGRKRATVWVAKDRAQVELSEKVATVRALLSEVRKKYRGKEKIVGLRSESQGEVLDVLLTMMSRPLNFLRDGEQLVAVFAESVPADISKAHFELLKVLGKGGSSTVVQARKLDTGQLFAIKILRKQFVLKEDKVGQIQAERSILGKVSHPFVVKLHYAFQSSEELFLVLDFCPGGELFYHLRSIKRLTEEQAKFYFGEIVLAIEYLHSMNILYRDLKPENVLLDVDGHIRLTDFGASKEGVGPTALRTSFCGSPEYMSPEMLSAQGHTRSVDFYSLGALLYELLTGLPPFYHQDRATMYRIILNEEVSLPSYLSQYAKSLISRLLDKNPKTRLGAQFGMDEIKAHPWCAQIPWERLLLKAKSPPFTPNLRKSNFDPEYTSLSVSEAEYDTPVMEDCHSFAEATEDPFPDFEFPEPDFPLDLSSSLSDASRSTKATSKHSTELFDSSGSRLCTPVPTQCRTSMEVPNRGEYRSVTTPVQESLADRVLRLQKAPLSRGLSPERPAAVAAIEEVSHSPKFCGAAIARDTQRKLSGPDGMSVKIPCKGASTALFTEEESLFSPASVKRPSSKCSRE